MSRWYIKRLDSLINPACPKPYYAGFGAGPLADKQTFWAEKRADAIGYMSAEAARSEAALVWEDWRDLVRIVRVKEGGG